MRSCRGCCSGPNTTIVMVQVLASAGVVLSVLTLTGCKFVNRYCTTTTGETTACSLSGETTYFGLYKTDVSTLYDDTTPYVPGGACASFLSDPPIDAQFKTARASAILGACLGGIGTLLVFTTRLFFFSAAHQIASGCIIMLACLFQGLTFLLLESQFCTEFRDNTNTTCKPNRDAWLCIASGACYLVAWVASCSLIPSVKKMAAEGDKEDQEEDLYAMDTDEPVSTGLGTGAEETNGTPYSVDTPYSVED